MDRLTYFGTFHFTIKPLSVSRRPSSFSLQYLYYCIKGCQSKWKLAHIFPFNFPLRLTSTWLQRDIHIYLTLLGEFILFVLDLGTDYGDMETDSVNKTLGTFEQN